MTFQEWSQNLEERASGGWKVARPMTPPWRCSSCNKLMYGMEWINERSYPSPVNTPSGLFISKEYSRVCHVCWEMWHAINLSSSGYWQGVEATDTKKKRQLGRDGDYLAA